MKLKLMRSSFSHMKQTRLTLRSPDMTPKLSYFDKKNVNDEKLRYSLAVLAKITDLKSPAINSKSQTAVLIKSPCQIYI